MRQGHDFKRSWLRQSSTVPDAALFLRINRFERLLGKGIEAGHLNDDALGRALDAIYAYGPEALYGQLAAQASSAWGYPAKSGT